MPPSRQPLLIVPIRDRRQGRRILTIRNCAISMLAVAVVIASFSIYQGRRQGIMGHSGGLFGPEAATTTRVGQKTDVIDEGIAADQSAPDPMLVAPAAGERPLVARPVAKPTMPVTTTTITPVSPAPIQGIAEGHGAAIVGDEKGVTAIKPPTTSTATSTQPRLSGGIFKE